jgi:hypothetical protein
MPVRTSLALLVQEVKTSYHLSHRRTAGRRATVWPMNAVTTLGGHRATPINLAAKAVVGPWVAAKAVAGPWVGHYGLSAWPSQ